MTKKISVQSEIEVLSLDELAQDEYTVLVKAQEISVNAYAPYSNFQVGAAVLLENGEILQSSNQENVSFPVGICAEGIVLGYAGANFPDAAPVMMAIVAKRQHEENWASVAPCGLCRQAINEAEVRFGKKITVLILRPDGTVFRISGIGNLLPLKFDDLIS